MKLSTLPKTGRLSYAHRSGYSIYLAAPIAGRRRASASKERKAKRPNRTRLREWAYALPGPSPPPDSAIRACRKSVFRSPSNGRPENSPARDRCARSPQR